MRQDHPDHGPLRPGIRGWLCVMLLACGPAAACDSGVAAKPSTVAHSAPNPEPLEPPPKRLIAIVPMGQVDPGRLERVAVAVRGAWAADTRIEPARPMPRSAWYAPRKRWRAERLLQAVEAEFPEGAWKALLVTEAEISTKKGDVADWGIGGLGILGGRTAVVSTHLIRRHSRTAEQLDERLRKLAVHELGHTLGLDHCQVFACVMADARGRLIRSLDASSEAFCGRCRRLIPRDR